MAKMPGNPSSNNFLSGHDARTRYGTVWKRLKSGNNLRFQLGYQRYLKICSSEAIESAYCDSDKLNRILLLTASYSHPGTHRMSRINPFPSRTADFFSATAMHGSQPTPGRVRVSSS